MNEMLVRYGLLPLYIKVDKKDEYLAALELADKKKDFEKLYECIMKGIMQSHVEMAEQA